MRIYLAARYSQNSEMRQYRSALNNLGHTVTSRWIDCHTDLTGDYSKSFDVEFLNSYPDKCIKIAEHDLEDIRSADLLILFSDKLGGKGGRHVEYGYALGLGKTTIIVGQRENVFGVLADCLCDSFDQCLSVLDRFNKSKS